MYCNSNCYLPIPPRDWSRVQNSCSLVYDIQNTSTIRLPYSGKVVPASTLDLQYAMLNKGNVLQYKKNSSLLTKNQRYSQIAKGLWTNRNTTWATQSTRGYTNPNTQSLRRVGTVNITLQGLPTTDPVTCPQPINIINYTLPIPATVDPNPEVIPPPPPPPTIDFGTEIPKVPDPVPEPPIVIQDLGTMICGTQENICTGDSYSQPTNQLCHPTSDSDVPGTIMELCWNDGTPTWFPRQRYIMTNSGNKWPVNATLFSAIKPLPPIISSVQNVDNEVTLNWTQNEACIPVTQFTIFQNNIPINLVSGTTFSTKITVMSGSTYTFYIIGSNDNVFSNPSNSVSITS